MNVKVCNLCSAFGKKLAANNVSFQLDAGRIYGFIGPNGSGKTTTLRIMAGVDRPDNGDVLYDDLSVVMYPDRARQFIGYMPDALPDFKDLKVWEYLDFFARSFGYKGDERRAVQADVEGFTGCDGFRDQFLNTLSKGMKQRVSLARALLHHPKVLLLDEPAAGLDPKARYELRVILKQLAERGMTIFLSSHILSELQDMCEGAVVIKEGHVVAAGLLDSLQEQLELLSTEADAAHGTPDSVHDVTMPVEQLPHVAVMLTTLGDSASLHATLAGLVACEGADIVGPHEVRAKLRGNDVVIPEVTAQLLASGIPIVGIQKLEMGLEEMFMKFTK